jgi:S-adenosylmethionine:tRNA ribosyltransferase-isomerase
MLKKNIKNTNQLAAYNYDLPKELIAQEPVSPRDAAKLMVINKTTGKIAHRRFFDLPEIFGAKDVLVFNDSKVIPARLKGQKETGGVVEIFLLTAQKSGRRNLWQCLIGGKVRAGQKISLTGQVTAEPLEKLDDKVWLVEFNASDKKLFSLGETPLPPYIKKVSKLADYQTVYAKQKGSVAAPTAGLHFTKKLLADLKKRGVKIEFVTLHVGLGTFSSVETEDILKHKMHSEWARIDAVTASRLNQYQQAGRRIVAVGTTAARTLESFTQSNGKIKAQSGWTDIFIYPGYKFKFVQALITNFHLPKSTLLMLVSALAGKPLIDHAYQEAIKKQYRFFSFGDGMLIE